MPHLRDVGINHMPQQSPAQAREVGLAGFDIRNPRSLRGEFAGHRNITTAGRGRQGIRAQSAARGSPPRRQRIQVIIRRPMHEQRARQSRGSPSRVTRGRTLRRTGGRRRRQDGDRSRETRQRISIHLRGDSISRNRRNSARQELAAGCGVDEATQRLRLQRLRDAICADDLLHRVALFHTGFRGADEEMVDLEGRLAGLTVCLG